MSSGSEGVKDTGLLAPFVSLNMDIHNILTIAERMSGHKQESFWQRHNLGTNLKLEGWVCRLSLQNDKCR